MRQVFSKTMIPDNPIPTKEKDLLHRQPLASRIAKVIDRFEGDESLVIGIEGEWGSGKTSFINLILEDLSTTGALLIKFNPWNFSDQNELIKDFFESLIDALKQADGKEGEEKAKRIKNYASKLLKQSEVTLSPEFSALGMFNVKLGDLHKFGGEEPLEKQKRTINKLLKELGKRIVIVIDDIDRLDSHETKLIFKLVKMTANFANTIFLLAYDKDKVCERIDEKGIKGDEYLKKIIQVGFTLPKPDPRDLYNILTSDLDVTIKDFEEKYWDDVRWGNLFHSGFKRFFPTIRDIKRYVSSLRLDLEIIGHEEINPIDFLGIEVIRVFAPAVYLAIADEKRVFTTTERLYIGNGADDDRVARRNICESIIMANAPEGLVAQIKEIILQLFPQVKGLYTNTYYGYEWQINWRKELRVCAEGIFDKYFALSIPSSTLSEKSMKDLLATIEDNVAFTENLKKLQADDKLRLVLERFLDRLDELTDQQRENLLVCVFDFAEGVVDRKRGLIDVQDIDTQTWRLGYQALKRVPPEKRVAFLTHILTSTQSVFSPIQLVNLLNHEIEEREKKESEEETLLNKEDIVGLNEICVDKIKQATKSGTLAANRKLNYLLFIWKEFDSGEPVKKYVGELIQTPVGLLAFLRGFEWEAMSQSMDSLVAKRTIKTNKKSMAEFIDINDLDKKVQELNKEKLGHEDAATIALYTNPPKDPLDEI